MNTDPNQWQIAAWQAALVGGIIAIVQVIFSCRRDARERRKNQFELSHRLLDEMYDEPRSGRVLEALDTIHRSKRKNVNQLWDSDMNAFKEALEAGPKPKDAKIEAIQMEVDCMLYHLNRIEIATQANLLMFRDIQRPFNYYVGILRPFRVSFEAYCRFAGYEKVIDFMNRFDEWK
jgi:hypothetical protein